MSAARTLERGSATMNRTETIEAEELSGRVLGIIGTYRMGYALDPHDLYLKPASEATPEDPIVVTREGYIEDGVYHLADPARWRRDDELQDPRPSRARRAAAA
jgi:hypothetical protein